MILTNPSHKPNWENRTLFHGDNLKFMRAMNSESVDLIATDPPFNKGRDFHATPDSLASGGKFQDRWKWERDVHQEWVDQIADDYPKLMAIIYSARFSHSDGMGAYICFMAVRLLEMYRLLKPTGSIYLHCDPTASHYLKLIMDAIFSWKNFRNEIVWCYTDPAGRRNTNYYKKTHDLILWYAKCDSECATNEMFMSSLSDATIRRYEPYFDAYGKITYQRLKDTNPGVFKSLKTVPEDLNKIWLDKNRGTVAGDWWTDIIPIRRKGKRQKAAEPAHYPTQKPLRLYERIIKTVTKENDIVLDPFCGCATTCIAAEKARRQWVGIDIWEEAHDLVMKRIKKEVGILGNVIYENHLPERTDNGEISAPFLRVKEKIKEPPNPWKSRDAMYKHLLEQNGMKCQGCYRTFDDHRYLELDHNIPKSDGGIDHITNRILLCGPCNKLKSNVYTLSGLRKKNRELGYMAKP